MSRTVVSPSTSPPHSPPLSGPPSPIQSRRVLHRRGSTTAADPWGNHLVLNMNPGRTTTCKLTIVRVNPTPPIQLDEQPPSPQHRRHVGFGAQSQNSLRRHGSHGTGKGENTTRMSFASASFAPPGASSGPGPRSGSPTHLGRRTSVPKPRLSADQLVSLAQQSCNPQSAPASPRTPGGSLAATTGSGYNSFTAIPDDVFLPFVDRADEVEALFTSPQPGARLLALLAQTFPPQPASESPVTDRIDETVFGTDPRQWSFVQLEYWVKQVDRDIAPDEVWVGLIRRCVLYRSELIWERIKGALGVPPELDPDGFEEDPYTIDNPVVFKDLKPDPSSDSAPQYTDSPPPIPDTDLQPTPDHVSESNVSASGGDSPVVSALSIEPVLMTTSPVGEHDRPPTRPGGHRMHDISEDVRGESSENEDEKPAEPDSSSSPAPREIIQGLRISTHAASPGLLASDSGQVASSLSRTMSASSMTQLQQPTHPYQVAGGGAGGGEHSSLPKRRWSYAASNASSEAYDVAGERGPGNPLFPTSFARLALGPTLTAKYVFFYLLDSQRVRHLLIFLPCSPPRQ